AEVADIRPRAAPLRIASAASPSAWRSWRRNKRPQLVAILFYLQSRHHCRGPLLSVGVLIAKSVRGFEVALFRRLQRAGPIFSRNHRDELGDPRNSSDCRRKNFVFVER